MTIKTKYKLIRTVSSRYIEASKNDKTKIFDELCATFKYSRKNVIKSLNCSRDDKKSWIHFF